MSRQSDGRLLNDVDPAQLERVLVLLRDRLPEVFKANRFFEEKTGFHNQAGTNNLVDALSHFSTLVEKARELGPVGQAEQVAMLEDHLRRSMMEAFEQLLKFRLADVAELWEQYLIEAQPILEGGRELPGAVAAEDLIDKREEVARLLDLGRVSKRMIDWEDWEEGTGALADACDLTEELQLELEASLAAVARERGSQRRIFFLGGLLLAALALGLLLGILVF